MIIRDIAVFALAATLLILAGYIAATRPISIGLPVSAGLGLIAGLIIIFCWPRRD